MNLNNLVVTKNINLNQGATLPKPRFFKFKRFLHARYCSEDINQSLSKKRNIYSIDWFAPSLHFLSYLP